MITTDTSPETRMPATENPPIGLRIRPATVEDASACCEIYEHYVLNTAITFELVPPSIEDMAHKIESYSKQHAFLVAEIDHDTKLTLNSGFSQVDGSKPNGDGDEHRTIPIMTTIVGYAYATTFNPREAYRWSCTTSVYVSHTFQSKGIGKALYTSLLKELKDRGYYQVFAGIALPNDGSIGIHEKFGFRKAGEYERCGYKLGKWWDVAWYQLSLREDDGIEPEEIQ